MKTAFAIEVGRLREEAGLTAELSAIIDWTCSDVN